MVLTSRLGVLARILIKFNHRPIRGLERFFLVLRTFATKMFPRTEFFKLATQKGNVLLIAEKVKK